MSPWSASRRRVAQALGEVCRQAGVALRLDEAAFTAAGVTLDRPLFVAITGETLQEALGRLIDWQAHPSVFREVRDGTLVLTTIEAMQRHTLRHLPGWLKPHYNNGLLATVDDAGDVTSLTSGDIMTDELLAKLPSLPKLLELHIDSTRKLTKQGIAHFGHLPAIQKLSLSSVNIEGAGLGDAALEAVSRLGTLRKLSVAECGTSDAGARYLEGMTQLTHLTLRQEGRLTGSAISSIARLKHLRSLDLSSLVATEAYGRMHFTPKAPCGRCRDSVSSRCSRSRGTRRARTCSRSRN